MANAVVAARTYGLRYGDLSVYQYNRDYRLGDTLELTGVDNTTVAIPLEDGVTQLKLDGVAGANPNTFSLPAGVHGQQVLVTCNAKAGGNVVVVPAGGVTAKQADGTTALASLTFGSAGLYALLKYTYNRWVVEHASATAA